MKKNVFLTSLLFLLATVIFGQNVQTESIESPAVTRPMDSALVITSLARNDTLRPLYLSRDSLLRFFSKKKRATLQFIKVQDNATTLLTWKGKNNRTYLKSPHVIPILNQAIVFTNIDEMVIFGDQKIIKENIKTLRENKDWDTVYFQPIVVKNDAASILFNKTVYNICYRIAAFDSENKKNVLTSNIYTNPSPPASISRKKIQ